MHYIMWTFAFIMTDNWIFIHVSDARSCPFGQMSGDNFKSEINMCHEIYPLLCNEKERSHYLLTDQNPSPFFNVYISMTIREGLCSVVFTVTGHLPARAGSPRCSPLGQQSRWHSGDLVPLTVVAATCEGRRRGSAQWHSNGEGGERGARAEVGATTVSGRPQREAGTVPAAMAQVRLSATSIGSGPTVVLQQEAVGDVVR